LRGTKMRKSGLLASTVLLTGLASNILAFEPAAWKYQGQMVIEDGPSEYGKLLVTPEIYNAARVDLGDIRCIHSNTGFWPTANEKLY
jgi:hypothetical protein